MNSNTCTAQFSPTERGERQKYVKRLNSESGSARIKNGQFGRN